jgi:hypothetical protein
LGGPRVWQVTSLFDGSKKQGLGRQTSGSPEEGASITKRINAGEAVREWSGKVGANVVIPGDRLASVEVNVKAELGGSIGAL